ncbi:MAG: hypothetical protein ACXWWC_01280 [Chitinophagaceae bacterium]
MTGIVGLLIFRSSFKKAKKILTESEKLRIEEIKNNAERIELEFDFCEFKSATYFHEVKDENISSLNLIASGLSFDETKTARVINSSLIYNYTISGRTEKFIGSFPCDTTTTKFYILNHKIALYVNRLDRTKYFFELEN